MTSALVYIGVMLIIICVWFAVLKRPIYEAVLISFLFLVFITNSWSNIWTYIDKGLNTSLIYSMIAFVAMSQLLSSAKVIDSCVGIILSLLGRITGGAGYVSVVASSFMGALSGSGPGNIMSTGVITIPAMKKSGFPAELAANVESNASYLGNMIPPSSNIVAALGAYLALYPNSEITTGQFWIVLWGIAIWFILQRLLMVFAFCKYYKVKPMSKEELPGLRETLRLGWKGLLLPIFIIVPFVLDFLLKDSLFASRLGETGAKYFSSSLLIFIPGLASMYILFFAGKKKSNIKEIVSTFEKGVKSLVPAVATCIFGYMIGALFADLDVAASLEQFIVNIELGKFGMVLVIPLITCFLGMIIPGSSLVVMFGTVFIAAFETVGVSPLLAAAMLPCICGTMCGITPPLALGMYAGMSIAESDFSKTVRNDLWWVAAQYVLEVLVLMGWLPIMGL